MKFNFKKYGVDIEQNIKKRFEIESTNQPSWKNVSDTPRLQQIASSVSWGCRIRRQHFCRGVRPTPMSTLDMTQNNQMVRLQFWSFRGMWSTPSLPLLPGSLWPDIVVPLRLLSMGQIELFDHLTMCKQMKQIKLLASHCDAWNNSNVCW